jgi:hypothetical protein
MKARIDALSAANHHGPAKPGRICRREVPKVGLEPTRGVNPTGF